MAHFARIQDGVVVEIVEVDGDPAERFHPSLTFMPASANCREGWVVDGDLLAAPPAPPVDLAKLKAAKRTAIDDAFDARVAAGVANAGHVYQIDPESRANLSGLATRAGFVLAELPGLTWPSGGQAYRTMANQWLALSPADMLGIAQKVADDYTAIRVRYAALKDACAGAADAVAVAAIDEEAGWPPVEDN